MTCNKIWFDKRKDAESYLTTTRASGKTKKVKNYANKKLKVYFCNLCGKYHITSSSKLKGKKLKIRKSDIERKNANQKFRDKWVDSE